MFVSRINLSGKIPIHRKMDWDLRCPKRTVKKLKIVNVNFEV